jgi:glycolate oxidase
MGLSAVRALLFAQSDRGPRAAEDVAEIARICTSYGAVEVAEASDAVPDAAGGSPAGQSGAGTLGVTLVDDVAVPRSKLVDLLNWIAEINAKYDVLICCPGHVGDGNTTAGRGRPHGPSDARGSSARTALAGTVDSAVAGARPGPGRRR